jgi:hypothetical protein
MLRTFMIVGAMCIQNYSGRTFTVGAEMLMPKGTPSSAEIMEVLNTGQQQIKVAMLGVPL